MRGRLRSLFLGDGLVPEQVRAFLEPEGVLHLEEGVRTTITWRNYRAPHRYSSWRREPAVTAVVVTPRRFGVLLRGRPFIHVPYADPRFDQLQVDAPDGALRVRADLAQFHDDQRGELTLRLRVADPQRVLALLAEQRRPN